MKSSESNLSYITSYFIQLQSPLRSRCMVPDSCVNLRNSPLSTPRWMFLYLPVIEYRIIGCACMQLKLYTSSRALRRDVATREAVLSDRWSWVILAFVKDLALNQWWDLTLVSKLPNWEIKSTNTGAVTHPWLDSFVTVKRSEFSSSHLTEPLMPWRKESIKSQHFYKNDYYFRHCTGHSSLVHENHIDFILIFSNFLANCHRDKIISIISFLNIISFFKDIPRIILVWSKKITQISYWLSHHFQQITIEIKSYRSYAVSALPV